MASSAAQSVGEVRFTLMFWQGLRRGSGFAEGVGGCLESSEIGLTFAVCVGAAGAAPIDVLGERSIIQ